MPTQITNQGILDVLAINIAELDSINAANEIITKRCEALSVENHRFVDLMNTEYGWGNWNNVDAKARTFVPKEEFTKSYYIIQNPAIQEKIEMPDDVVTQETTVDKSDKFMVTGFASDVEANPETKSNLEKIEDKIEEVAVEIKDKIEDIL